MSSEENQPKAYTIADCAPANIPAFREYLNEGEFEPSNPNIRYETAEEVATRLEEAAKKLENRINN